MCHTRRVRALPCLPLAAALACSPPNTGDTTSASTSVAATSDSPTASPTTSTPLPSAATTAESGFIPSLDSAAPECDPGRQDCPAGQKCTPYASEPGCCVDSTRCVAVTGELGAGDPCTRADDNDDCAAGLFCLTSSSGGAGAGACVAMCIYDDPNACDPGACVEFNDGFLPLCRPPCDPLAPTCPEDQACYAVLPALAFVCLTSNPPTGGGQPGDPCETVTSCQPGHLCAPLSELPDCPAELCCTAVCRLDDPDCPAPLTCVQAFDPQTAPDYADVGYCRAPI